MKEMKSTHDGDEFQQIHYDVNILNNLGQICNKTTRISYK